MSALGSWADVFDPAPDEVRRIAEALRAVIHEVDPGVVETARPGDRAVTFGTGPRKMKDGWCYLMPQKGRVNLGFYEGAALPDPGGMLEGTGKALRHVKVADLAMAEAPELRALIARALARKRDET